MRERAQRADTALQERGEALSLPQRSEGSVNASLPRLLMGEGQKRCHFRSVAAEVSTLLLPRPMRGERSGRALENEGASAASGHRF